MSDFEIYKFNQRVMVAHYSQYDNGKNILIDTIPNGNQIYHLYVNC